MTRLPIPNADDGNWGNILNDFLSQSHKSDGMLKDGSVSNATLSSSVQASLSAADNAIPLSQKAASGGVASLTGTTLTAAQLPVNVITKSASSGDTGKAIDAYTGQPLAVGNGSFIVDEPSGDLTGATDTANINAAITAAVTAGGGEVILQAGTYRDNGGHTDSSVPIHIRGLGRGVTIIHATSAMNGDMFTLNGVESGISSVTLNCYGATAGDGIVFNGAHCYANNFEITSPPGNGITLGKAGGAIVTRLSDGLIRLAGAYGIRSIAASGASDCLLTDLDIGLSGLSGVRLDQGGQNLTNVHTWGSGWNTSSNDCNGFRLNSTSNLLSNCQGETNLGRGIWISGSGNCVTGGRYWGNCTQGIYMFSVSRNTITGAQVFNNGVNNTGGSTGESFANIAADSTTSLVISGCEMWDDGTAIAAITYSGFTPTTAFTGRSAIFTVSAHYYEGTSTDRSVITGNSMRASASRTGLAVGGTFGANSIVELNDTESARSFRLVTATALAGYTLVNGTGTVLSWTAPNDGILHFAEITSMKITTSTETGGAINVTGTTGGVAWSKTLIGAAQAGPSQAPGNTSMAVAFDPNTTVAVTQATALTAGASKLFAGLFAQ